MTRLDVDEKFRTEGRCRLCLRPGSIRPLTRHRIVPGAFGGRYVPENCVPLCRLCHDLIDNRDRYARATARRMLRAVLWPIEVAYATRQPTFFAIGGSLERTWSFDSAYPRPSRELVLERRAATAV